MRERENQYVRCQSRDHEAGKRAESAKGKHARNAIAIRHATADDAANTEADHGHRVGQRSLGAANSEFFLHLRQHHRQYIHRAIAECD